MAVILFFLGYSRAKLKYLCWADGDFALWWYCSKRVMKGERQKEPPLSATLKWIIHNQLVSGFQVK